MLRAAAERLDGAEGEIQQRRLGRIDRHVRQAERGALVETQDFVVDQRHGGAAQAAGTQRVLFAQRIAGRRYAPDAAASALDLHRPLGGGHLSDRRAAFLGCRWQRPQDRGNRHET